MTDSDMSISQVRRIAKRAAREAVEEQLAEQLADQNAATGDPTDPNEWAYEVMSGQDIQNAQTEQLAVADYVSQEYGVDPRNCSSREEFAQKVASAEGD